MSVSHTFFSYSLLLTFLSANFLLATPVLAETPEEMDAREIAEIVDAMDRGDEERENGQATSRFDAKKFSGKALGIHIWGRELQGPPTSCNLIIDQSPQLHFEGRSFTLNMDINAKTAQGEAMEGYFYLFQLGAYPLRSDSGPNADPHYWQKAKRISDNQVEFETLEASYGGEEEQVIASDKTKVKIQASKDWKKVQKVEIMVQRTYTKAALKFDKMMRELGFPGDDLISKDIIGKPIEVTKVSCQF